jgi:hypothetical protein
MMEPSAICIVGRESSDRYGVGAPKRTPPEIIALRREQSREMGQGSGCGTAGADRASPANHQRICRPMSLGSKNSLPMSPAASHSPRARDGRGRSTKRARSRRSAQVGPICKAAARGSVVLGRDKKACLSDETTTQDTLKQNWSKYATSNKNECIGMVTTGGPASYVELLSRVEILRDARNIRRTDVLETDTTAASSRRRRRR